MLTRDTKKNFRKAKLLDKSKEKEKKSKRNLYLKTFRSSRKGIALLEEQFFNSYDTITTSVYQQMHRLYMIVLPRLYKKYCRHDKNRVAEILLALYHTMYGYRINLRKSTPKWLRISENMYFPSYNMVVQE